MRKRERGQLRKRLKLATDTEDGAKLELECKFEGKSPIKFIIRELYVRERAEAACFGLVWFGLV